MFVSLPGGELSKEGGGESSVGRVSHVVSHPGVGFPDVRQKEDISSFLKTCPPSGRHCSKVDKWPAFLL